MPALRRVVVLRDAGRADAGVRVAGSADSVHRVGGGACGGVVAVCFAVSGKRDSLLRVQLLRDDELDAIWAGCGTVPPARSERVLVLVNLFVEFTLCF